MRLDAQALDAPDRRQHVREELDGLVAVEVSCGEHTVGPPAREQV